MKIYENEQIIEHIIYIAKCDSSAQNYITEHRQSDSFVYILSGEVEYEDKYKRFVAKKGNIIYLSEGSNYKINIKNNNYSFIVVNFLFRKHNNMIFENELFEFNNSHNLDSYFIKLNTIWPIGTIDTRLTAKAILYEIYAQLCSYSINNYLPSDSKKLILSIKNELMENCFDSKLNITEIIKSYKISEAHFRRQFKKIYNCSPIKLIQNIRINRAKQLLSNPQLQISEISKTCGYDDVFYFSRIFKKTTGLSPSEYRKLSNLYYK